MDWLMKILGMGQGGAGGAMPSFGALGGGGSPGGIFGGLMGGGSRPPMMPAPAPASMAAPNNGGMPMSGVGPGGAPTAGAPMNLAPGATGGGSPGLWSGGSPSPAGQNLALGQAMNLIKGPQFQPTQWMPWMPQGGRG